MASKLNEYRTLLEQLYVYDDHTVKEISEYMRVNYQVDLNGGACQRTFRKWGLKKNRKHNHWAWVDKKKIRREVLGKQTQFTYQNRVVDDATIRKNISRNVSTRTQITTVTTPRTPTGWAAITPAASTPGCDPSVPRTPRSESPIEHEENATTLSPAKDSSLGDAVDTNPASQNEVVAQTKVLVQTMVECGTFIITWARAYLPTDRAATSSRYLEVAKGIVAVQYGTPVPLVDGSDEFATALHILRLTFFNDYSQLEELLRRTISIADEVLRTALFLTCKGNQRQAAALLLSYRVKPDSRDTNGVPCLIVASRNNLDKIVRILLQYGANLNMTDRAGETPWSHICGLRSHDVVASILSAAGAKKDVNRFDGFNPLYRASTGGHVDQVRVMLERGMNPSFATPYGWQPLHWAASNIHPRIVKMLVEARADINPISDPRKTPLDMVFSKPDATDIREFLISHDAKTELEMRCGTRATVQNGMFDAYSSDTGDELEFSSDSGFESDDGGDVQRTTSPQETAIHPNPPAVALYTQTQVSP